MRFSFPEKRPFFQENSNFFQTPLQLVFTRRIGNPLYGVRLTGKAGPWAIGSMVANDRSPGTSVIGTDPLSGENAYFGILRVNRELGKNNSVGMIYTDRELHTAPNSLLHLSALRRWGSTAWAAWTRRSRSTRTGGWKAQAVTSETKFSDGTHLAGPAYHVYAERSSRNLEFNTMYLDIAQGFNAETGFINRTDIRRFSNFINRTFHTEGKHLIVPRPRLFQLSLWDHNGTRLNHQINPSYSWNFPRNSFIGMAGMWEHERLRPSDFSTLPSNRDYTHVIGAAEVGTQYFKWINLDVEMDWGTATNFVPRYRAAGAGLPEHGVHERVVRPMKGLTVENTYIMTRLLDQDTHLNIFNNHIMRSKWNYQFTKEFSLRMIGQYVTTISNPGLTTLQTTKSFNGDVLFTYLLNPGTAIYAGYNSNLENLDPRLQFTADGLLRTRNTFINDGRQIFIKLSYLFRY